MVNDMSATVWTTGTLTRDLATKLRLDGYLVVAEATLRPQTGQRADLLAMRRKLSHSPMLIVEIKTGRGDLLADIKRNKWRGYLADGAVVFAFPKGLAEPAEIPTEAGVMVRTVHGWTWKRAPRWSQAPMPSNYLYRRMALTVSDQSAAAVRTQMTPKAASLWHAARQARQAQGRRLATIAQDVETWAGIVQKDKDWFDAHYQERRELERAIAELRLERFALENEIHRLGAAA